MQIGQVIRKYRKEKNLTQEEVARRLGVTPPAVNKWERGASLPDIGLLAPLARLLGVSCDTLLNYKEDLTPSEINQLSQQAKGLFEQEGFTAVLSWAQAKMAEYPNCEQLILNLTALLEVWRTIALADSAVYDDFISANFERLLSSSSEEIRTKAAEMLFNFYLRRENYGQAEKYLPCFSMQNPERQRKQALIYSKTNQIAKAWQTYEQLLFSTGNQLELLLFNLYALAKKEDNPAKAKMLADKQSQLARLLELGEYNETASQLDFAVWQQDAAASVQFMEQLLNSSDSFGAFLNAPLYEHLQFKQPSANFTQEIKQKLLEDFQDIESYPFIQQDAAAYQRWQQLTQKK